MNPGSDMSLDQLKNWNKDLVNAIRDGQISKGFTFNGIVYDSDDSARQNVTGACTLALVLLGQQLDFPEGFTWRTQDNDNTPMNASSVISMALTLGNYVTTCYGVSWYHKANIDAMTDINTLQNYDVMTGWPS
jgi:hypothetical protein